MKALFVSNDPAIFLPDSPVRDRMRQYAAQIGELHVLSAGKHAKEEQEGALFLHPVAPGFFRLHRLRSVARNLVRAHDVAVVSAQDPFEHGRIALDAIAGTNAKLHVQVHTDFLAPAFAKESLKNAARVKIADAVLPKAHGIRVVSKRVHDALIARYETRIVEPSVIPIAPSPVAVPAMAFPPHTFTFTLLAVGRLEPEKRYEDLFDALALVLTKYPRTGLFVAGDGREKDRLQREAAKRGVGENVVFLGDVPQAQSLMKSAHAFVQASAYEGYGRTLVEAALMRVPIVSTDAGIVGEVLAPEREVLSCAVGDVSCLAGQMCRLIEDNQLRRALTVNAEAAVLVHLAKYQNLPALIAADLARLAS